MRIHRFCGTWICVAFGCLLAATAHGQATFRYAPVGDLVMARDDNTLIVSIPSKASLVYIDTSTGKEIKTVEVDFQPSKLAVQGKKLFATVKGSAKIFVLDADTGKAIKEIAAPGEPFENIACHRSKGLLYAVNVKYEVFAIDPEKGTAEKTKAKGQLLVVEPSEGKFVYSGIQKPITETLVIEEVGGDKFKLSLMQANTRALMLKYAVDGAGLKLISANDNAAINGRGMAISSDGKQIAMAGGGGWSSKSDPRGNYAIAVFDTNKMKELKGQVDTGPYPNNVAFHPVLNLGAAFNTKEVMVFNAKSYVVKDNFKTADDSFNHSGFLLFAGRGTKVIHCSYNAPIRKDSVLEIFSLTLTPADQETLKKAYGGDKK